MLVKHTQLGQYLVPNWGLQTWRSRGRIAHPPSWKGLHCESQPKQGRWQVKQEEMCRGLVILLRFPCKPPEEKEQGLQQSRLLLLLQENKEVMLPCQNTPIPGTTACGKISAGQNLQTQNAREETMGGICCSLALHAIFLKASSWPLLAGHHKDSLYGTVN